TRDQLTSPLEVTNQAFAILIRSRTLEQRKTLASSDIIIDPPLGRFASADFSRVPQAIRAGERGAREVKAALANLSLSEAAYQSYLAARKPRSVGSRTIDFVRTDE